MSIWPARLRSSAASLHSVHAVALGARARSLRAGFALGRAGVGVLRVAAAVVIGLGNAAQVAGVAVATWAAWGFDETAGRAVLAAGLLFLGGALRRLVHELRG